MTPAPAPRSFAPALAQYASLPLARRAAFLADCDEATRSAIEEAVRIDGGGARDAAEAMAEGFRGRKQLSNAA